MSDWRDNLYRELDEWNYLGVAASFWWRDDDAQCASDELTRMLDLARRYDAPIALAVIPHAPHGGHDDLAGLAAKLQGTDATDGNIFVLQHGYAHRNHAVAHQKKIELGGNNAAVRRELAQGFATLRGQFGAQFLPVLVPPWNRIDAALLPDLAELGFGGLSVFGARQADMAADMTAGMTLINAHIDIIDWKGGGFIGKARAVDAIVSHLKLRRSGEVDDEPSGLLTHHLVHDAQCNQFLAELLAMLDDHPAAKWVNAATIFGANGLRVR